MHYDYEYNKTRTTWATCLQATIQAGISASAMHQAMMLHRAHAKTQWDKKHARDPWQEWCYCLRSIGLPETKINRVKQLYFHIVTHQGVAAQLR